MTVLYDGKTYGEHASSPESDFSNGDDIQEGTQIYQIEELKKQQAKRKKQEVYDEEQRKIELAGTRRFLRVAGMTAAGVMLSGIDESKPIEVIDAAPGKEIAKNDSKIEQHLGISAEQRKNRAELYKDPDNILLARLIFGEARGTKSDQEMRAVAWTVINRLRAKKDIWGKTLKDVVLKDEQYSCFNTPSKAILNPEHADSEAWQQCLAIANEFFEPDGSLKQLPETKDPLTKVHYYHAVGINKPPEWPGTIKPIKIAGITSHIFYH